MADFSSGDPIWYRQVKPGGYGFGLDVPGVFVYRTPRRVRVRLSLRDGSPVLVTVSPQNVRPRLSAPPGEANLTVRDLEVARRVDASDDR